MTDVNVLKLVWTEGVLEIWIKIFTLHRPCCDQTTETLSHSCVVNLGDFLFWSRGCHRRHIAVRIIRI